MDLYLLLVFIHVAGAVGIFAALGAEAVAFEGLSRASTVTQARTWVALLRRNRIGPVAMTANLITGIWMMAVRWGPQAWMIVAFAGLIVMIALGLRLTTRTVARLDLAGEPTADLPAWQAAATRRTLALSLWLRVSIALGIVGLMTIKPAITGSLTIMIAAVLIGLAVAMRPDGRPSPATT